jgi:hypothetical protein
LVEDQKVKTDYVAAGEAGWLVDGWGGKVKKNLGGKLRWMSRDGMGRVGAGMWRVLKAFGGSAPGWLVRWVAEWEEGVPPGPSEN